MTARERGRERERAEEGRQREAEMEGLRGEEAGKMRTRAGLSSENSDHEVFTTQTEDFSSAFLGNGMHMPTCIYKTLTVQVETLSRI